MTEDEVNQHRGLLHDKKDRMKPKHSGMLKFNEAAVDSIPDELDWRDYGKNTQTCSEHLDVFRVCPFCHRLNYSGFQVLMVFFLL